MDFKTGFFLFVIVAFSLSMTQVSSLAPPMPVRCSFEAQVLSVEAKPDFEYRLNLQITDAFQMSTDFPNGSSFGPHIDCALFTGQTGKVYWLYHRELERIEIDGSLEEMMIPGVRIGGKIDVYDNIFLNSATGYRIEQVYLLDDVSSSDSETADRSLWGRLINWFKILFK